MELGSLYLINFDQFPNLHSFHTVRAISTLEKVAAGAHRARLHTSLFRH